MGEASAEVWTNLGLSCFYAGQYDLCFSCFERGLSQADDSLLPDVWYNIGQVSSTGGTTAWLNWGLSALRGEGGGVKDLRHMSRVPAPKWGAVSKSCH